MIKPDQQLPEQGLNAITRSGRGNRTVRELRISWRLDDHLLVDPAALKKSLNRSSQSSDLFWGKANSLTEVRGRNPSRGWVLISGDSLQKIDKPQHAIHTISISDGQRSYKRKGLIITRATCVTPNRVDATYPLDGLKPDPTSVYLLELADSRYYASWGTLVYRSNLRDPEGQFPYERDKSWSSTLDDMWKGLPRLMGRLAHDNSNGREEWPYLGPESLKFPGTNAWDSFNQVLDQLSRCIAPNPAGGYITYGLSIRNGVTWLSPSEKQHLTDALSTSLLHGEGGPIRPHVPESIRVYFHSRDYQWWRNRGQTGVLTKTPQDFIHDFPARYHDYSSTDFLNAAGVKTAAIIPGTTKHVWSTLPVMMDDQGEIHGAEALREHGKTLARDCVEAFALFQRYRGYTFSGLWPYFRVGPVFSGVAFYDLGEGLKTRLFTRPKDFDATTNNLNSYNESAHKPSNPDEDWIGPPDIQRHRPPRAREAYGILLPHHSQSGKTTEGKTKCWSFAIPGGKLAGQCKPGQIAEVSLLASQLKSDDNDDTVRQWWYGVDTIKAINALDQSIMPGKRVMLRWNPQAGFQGAWQIISYVSAPDVQEECIKEVEEKGPSYDYRRKRNPQLITVRKNSSLSLVDRKPKSDNDSGGSEDDEESPHKYKFGEYQDPESDQLCEAIIDIAPGPPNTIFSSKAEKDEEGADTTLPPRWSYNPVAEQSITAGQWVKLGLDNNENQSWIGPPRTGSVKLRLPGDPQENSHLVAGSVQGDSVETKWVGPGLNTTVTIPNPLGTDITLKFKSGILVESSVESGWPEPGEIIQAFSHNPTPDYDPCGVNPPPTTTPIPPPVPPPEDLPQPRPDPACLVGYYYDPFGIYDPPNPDNPPPNLIFDCGNTARAAPDWKAWPFPLDEDPGIEIRT